MPLLPLSNWRRAMLPDAYTVQWIVDFVAEYQEKHGHWPSVEIILTALRQL